MNIGSSLYSVFKTVVVRQELQNIHILDVNLVVEALMIQNAVVSNKLNVHQMSNRCLKVKTAKDPVYNLEMD